MSDSKILESAKRIREKFKTELADEEENDMEFIDEVDAHIKDVLGDDRTDVYTALSKERLERWKKKRWSRVLRKFSPKKTFYACLLAAITAFLVREASDFYAIGGSITAYALIKAILTEVCFIFLSGYRAVGKVQTILVSMLRTALFTLMLFVISSTVMFQGANVASDIKNISSQVAILEGEIRNKEKEIDYYISIKWPRNATEARKEKEKLVTQLIELKREQIEENKNEGVADLVKYRTWGRAAFRVLLLFISVLITRRLFSF